MLALRGYDAWPLPDPLKSPYGVHIKILRDGTAQDLTEEGRDLIRKLQLNRKSIIEFRCRILRLCDEHSETVSSWLTFPDDLPNLAILRPRIDGRNRKSRKQSWYVITQGQQDVRY